MLNPCQAQSSNPNNPSIVEKSNRALHYVTYRSLVFPPLHLYLTTVSILSFPIFRPSRKEPLPLKLSLALRRRRHPRSQRYDLSYLYYYFDWFTLINLIVFELQWGNVLPQFCQIVAPASLYIFPLTAFIRCILAMLMAGIIHPDISQSSKIHRTVVPQFVRWTSNVCNHTTLSFFYMVTWKAEIMPSKMTPLLTSPYRGSGGLFSTSSLAYPGFCRCSRGNREWQIRGCERFKFASDTVKMINTVNCNSNGLSLIFISYGKRQITVAMNTVD